ncbi:MAG: glycosyltransferase [Paludibacteraceae bacterium]|nr:glycosyltransferase [Paludibacteraceae bacterium]
MTKPNLLILSDPPIAPGYLPRLRFLCQYLHEHGYNVHLFTEEKESLLFEHTYPITTIPTYTGSTLDWLMKAIWSLFTNWHERHFAAKVEQIIGNEQYSQIICTTFSTFPLGAAVRIARNRHLPLVADIRDIDEQIEHSTYQYAHQQWWLKPFRHVYRTIQLRRRNNAIRQVNTVTTVSPWHVDFLKRYNPHVHLIYNGFDPKQFYFQAVPTDVFRITYIGSMFGHYDISPLYQAVNELQLENIVVDIHTPKQQPIAHTELGDTIRKSSIMLVLTSKTAHGMMTTKFSEALGCEKPIICIPSDEGCLAQAIADTHAGIATESVDEIKQFIMSKYREWQQNGYTRQCIQNKDLFDREYLAHEFETLLYHSAHL